ncbi:cytochrome P450 monooxygenase-like protein [Amylocarpus encephaloides]|uniref:Cytochrome P450 monooxygenase-like protein n=1 Tax=Amylocarpus encephaloides TaxID=45428 RepID=A0A9P8C0G7_9HELO|nr:cytochrome P450 monooxygenase-like protein [Amylocarpus encephaloides]
MPIPLKAFAFVGSGLGVASHLGYFIHGEHHMEGMRIFLAFFLVPAFTFATILRYGNSGSYVEASTITTVITASYTISLFSSIATYRIFFHPLRNFPGPTKLKFSKFNHSSLVVTEGTKNFQTVDRLHKEYGEFVRVGPNELSITAPEAVNQILGAGTKCRKAEWYDCVAYPEKALNLERNRIIHGARRKIWDRAFSAKSLRDYEGRVKIYTDQLMSQLNANSGKAIDACQWFNFYAFDIMGEMAFGQSFEMIKSGTEHKLLSLMHNGMASIGPLTPIAWILPLLKQIPGAAKESKEFVKYNTEQVARRKQYTPEAPDLFSFFIDAEKNDPNPMHKDPNWLIGDCGLVIVAGSDTTTATLSHIFYHLAKSPHIFSKLREELDSSYQAGSYTEFKDLQEARYLNGIINEALRLHPPTPSGLLRVTPPEGITIKETIVPGNVTVSTPFWSIGRLESCYEKASEFVPERWYEKPEMVIEKNVFVPFSAGPMGCVGKQLGLMELRNVTARIVSQFDVKFAPGEDGTGLLEKSRDVFTLALASMMLMFTRRER